MGMQSYDNKQSLNGKVSRLASKENEYEAKSQPVGHLQPGRLEYWDISQVPEKGEFNKGYEMWKKQRRNWLQKRNTKSLPIDWPEISKREEGQRVNEIGKRIRRGQPFSQPTPLWYLMKLLNIVWAAELEQS